MNHRQIIDEAFSRAGFPELSKNVELKYSNKMYAARGLARCIPIRLSSVISPQYEITLSNKHVLADKDGEAIRSTILHECGHVLAWHRFGVNIPGHGREWRDSARKCGLHNPTRCYSDGVGMKVYRENKRKNAKRRLVFSCLCGDEQYKLTQKQAKYRLMCRKCKQVLQNTGKVLVVY